MGPQREVRLLGQPIADMHFHALAPIGLYFGIITYNGAASAGVTTTPETCRDPAALAHLWTVCWAELRAAAAAAEVSGGAAALAEPRREVPRGLLVTVPAAVVVAAVAARSLLGLLMHLVGL